MRAESGDQVLVQCVRQGYVPKDCQLAGVLVFFLVNKGEDPCAGCNHDRTKCGGREKR